MIRTRYILICMACTVILCTSVLAQSKDIDPNRAAVVKAGYLYNFTRFVDWPDDAFANESSPIVIGVLGDDRIATLLTKAVAGKEVRKRKLVVRSITIEEKKLSDVQAVELRQYHLLFISKTQYSRWPDILNVVKDEPLLTVSDAKGFIDQEGTIQLVMLKNKFALHINLDAADRHHLKISSRLVKLAKVIKKKKEKKDK